jgi:hypothetical protein
MAVDKLDASLVSHCALQYVGLLHRFKAVAKEVGDGSAEAAEAEAVGERLAWLQSNNELLQKRLLKACQVRC